MSPPTDPRTAALLDHVFSQTLSNISFLAAHDYISPVDASELSSRLTASQGRGNAVDNSLANSMQALAVAPVAIAAVPPPIRRNVPEPLQPRSRQARALWAYNEDGREPNDLSFSQGEIVEIVDETNADWWTGKCRGRQGLFPSNHVEKLNGPASPAAAPVASPVSAPYSHGPPQPIMPIQPMGGPPAPQYSPGYADPKPVYRPFGAVYQQADQPPPAQAGQVNSIGLQQTPGQGQGQDPKKPSRFGRLGETMANSAAGGVGFGAGAAIGSGIVNAIF